MNLDVAGICLIVLFVVFISLPQAVYIRLKVPLSLRHFMSGVVGVAALGLVVFDYWRVAGVIDLRVLRVLAIDYREWGVLIGMGLLSPLWFSIGARRSLREVGSHRAKVLRWVNVVGFALSVGLIAGYLIYYNQYGYYGFQISLTTAAVVVLAFSRLFLWQRPTRFRWAGFPPGYPAILLMPAVLVAWAVLCSYSRMKGVQGLDREPGWFGNGFPLPFYGVWWGPDAGSSGLEFRLTPYLVDLLLAVTRPPETGPEGMLGFWTLEGGRDGEEATYVGADYPEAT